MERLFLQRQQELGQTFTAQSRVNKKDDEQSRADTKGVEEPPYALPARLSRIVKNGLRHVKICQLILSCGGGRVKLVLLVAGLRC